LETQLSQLINIYRNEKTLSYQPLINSDISNSIDLTHDSYCFGNQDSYTPFLEQSLEEKSDLEKSIEILQESALQFQKSSAQSINRLETQLSQLVNIYKNEKIFSYQPLTNSDISNSIDLTQDCCYCGNQDSISAYPSKLDQTLTFRNPIDILASYPFPTIELTILNLNLVIQFYFLIQ